MRRTWTLVVLCFLLFYGPLMARAEKIDTIAAIVNGDIITDEELNTFVKIAAMDEENADLFEKNPKDLKRTLLERMIEDRLILQEAKRLDIKTDEKMIDDRIKEIKEKAGSEGAFQLALKEQGISLSELREKLKNQLLIYFVIQREVKAKIQVSPKEVTDYFQEHKNEFITPETVVVDSLFVPDKAALEEVETQLGGGRDFGEIAKQYSKKASLGRLSRGQLKKELENFIFALGPGDVSKPFEAEDGFYIFLVKEKAAACEKDIDEVKTRITNRLEYEKMQRKLKGWIEELKETAYVSIREPGAS